MKCMQNRREFLQTAAAGVGSLAFGPFGFGAQENVPNDLAERYEAMSKKVAEVLMKKGNYIPAKREGLREGRILSFVGKGLNVVAERYTKPGSPDFGDTHFYIKGANFNYVPVVVDGFVNLCLGNDYNSLARNGPSLNVDLSLSPDFSVPEGFSLSRRERVARKNGPLIWASYHGLSDLAEKKGDDGSLVVKGHRRDEESHTLGLEKTLEIVNYLPEVLLRSVPK
ncbi:hypothetical protein CMI48_03255 [Candidatus Pacearchaeota archaeon]|nr:hypothetical protein [Candidatus Pacearchaeota archaeon]